MKLFLKILKIIGNSLFVASIILLLLITAVILLMQLGSDGRMMIGKYSFARVVTGSMEPEIPTGSFILIETVDSNHLNVGDTISFWSDDPSVPQGAPVVHKIIRIEESAFGDPYYITKGVANSEEDEYPVYPRNVVGRLVWQSAFLGALVGVAQAPFMYPILISVLAICLIVNVISVIKEAKRLSDQSNEAAVKKIREETLEMLEKEDAPEIIEPSNSNETSYINLEDIE